jgi:hypothetical protein
MRKKTMTIILRGLIFASLVITFTLYDKFYPEAPSSSPAPDDTTSRAGSQTQEPVPPIKGTLNKPVATPATEENLTEVTREDVSNMLRDSFGNHINHPRIQLEAIEKLIKILKETYQDDWREHVLDYLTDAFPDYANILYQAFLNFEAYKRWVDENYETLLGMTHLERKDFIWETRKQYFGEDALTIWEAEVNNDALVDALQRIDDQRSTTFGTKLDTYMAEINRIYSDKAGGFKTQHQQKLMDNFLNLDAVQQDLHEMSILERQENLHNIRKAMGLDEAALKRWDDLDRKRDERWALGREYMKKREALENEYSGVELERRLDDIRQNYFGSEADVIKNEESGGFSRFKDRPRRYGMN